MRPQAIAVPVTESRPYQERARLFWLGFLALSFFLFQALAAQAKPESLAPLAEKVSPAVVNITTSTVVEGRTGPQGIVPEGSPL